MTTINADSIDPWSLPCVEYGDRDKLPDSPGVYFVISGKRVLYVGKAESGLLSRWRQHHRGMQVSMEDNAKIYYLTCLKKEAAALELDLLKIFCPAWNGVVIPRECKAKKNGLGTIKFTIQLPGWDDRKLRMMAKYRGMTRAALASSILMDELDAKRSQIENDASFAAKYLGVTMEEFERDLFKEE